MVLEGYTIKNLEEILNLWRHFGILKDILKICQIFLKPEENLQKTYGHPERKVTKPKFLVKLFLKFVY